MAGLNPRRELKLRRWHDGSANRVGPSWPSESIAIRRVANSVRIPQIPRPALHAGKRDAKEREGRLQVEAAVTPARKMLGGFAEYDTRGAVGEAVWRTEEVAKGRLADLHWQCRALLSRRRSWLTCAS